MAKNKTARLGMRCVTKIVALGLCTSVHGPRATAAEQPPAKPAAVQSRVRKPQWVKVPRVNARLTALDIGLVINTADPYSVEVGEHYARARNLQPQQILRVSLPVKPGLTLQEFESLQAAIDAHFTARTQALALAWTMPYAVSCNSISGALALGFDSSLCASRTSSCAPSKRSAYFNAATSRPYSDLNLRPSMLLAAKDVATAVSLIDRGVQADHSLGLKGAPPVNAYFTITKDGARNVRATLFPPPGPLRAAGVVVQVQKTEALQNPPRVLIYETGATHVDKLDTVDWVPGALADHLTSFGGRLDGKGEQMSALEWIDSGATASYGTVSEPCAYQQKFPHPQVLLLNYLQGATAIEAYWKSVAWPQQGIFIGEPLAAPFAKAP